jgi:4-hydroxyacetophenone monooxygenase
LITQLQQQRFFFDPRFHTTVAGAEYNEKTNKWIVRVDGPDGQETLEGNVFVSAVGQLSNPNIPPIPGLGKFETNPAKKSMHTAYWDADHDLSGKNVAVIGTGASAMQVVRTTAPKCKTMTIFQLIPSWWVTLSRNI